MSHIVIGIIVVLIFAVVIFFIHNAVENGGLWWLGLAGAMVAIIAMPSYAVTKENETGSCVKKEIQYHYNPALKMPMPAEVCVQRGVWVDD